MRAYRPIERMKTGKLLSLWAILTALALVVATGTVRAQGHYAPVADSDLIGASFNHYYDANMKAVIPPDFSWTFTATNLVIKLGKGPIPADLLQQLAAGAKDVKTIVAGWKVEAGQLVITGPTVDGEPRRTMVKLPVNRTAPTVIRIGQHQYVFSPGPAKAARP